MLYVKVFNMPATASSMVVHEKDNADPENILYAMFPGIYLKKQTIY